MNSLMQTRPPWRPWQRPLAAAVAAAVCLCWLPCLSAQQAAPSGQASHPPDAASSAKTPADPENFIEKLVSRSGLSSTLSVMLLLGVVSLAPAALLMTTSFIRLMVVLGLLRQAIGTPQLPPTQVITSLALFLSLLIMTPVWKRVYDEAVAPYSAGEKPLEQAWRDGQQPVRRFMSRQIERAGNTDDVHLFLDYLDPPPEDAAAGRANYVYYGARPQLGERDVPLQALLPAFMLSELKTAFLIGFQIYLPFLVLDIVIASVLVSMGMMMTPPALISLPFKLLLFVLVDGWRLVVGTMLESFVAG